MKTKTKTKSQLLKTAEQIEQQLAESEALFTAVTAALYEIDPTNPESINGLVLIDRAGDIYELLENNTPTGSNPIALTTLGWAAPLPKNDNDNQTPPSQHPQRRRVSLFTTVNQAGQMASVMRFQDTNETTPDDGEARGALAEALLNIITN
jgi:hypothetical protein